MQFKLSEKQIETQILDFLNRTKGCLFYKQNNGAVFDPSKGTFRKSKNPYTPNGVADIYGSFFSRATYIEVKTPEEYAYLAKHYDELRVYFGPSKKKNHLREQIFFIENNLKFGNIAFFADSVKRVAYELSKIHQGETNVREQQANA